MAASAQYAAGLTMSDDVLASIDATLSNQCSCGCGATISDRGPSAWFATERCQERWNRNHNPSGQPSDSDWGTDRNPTVFINGQQLAGVRAVQRGGYFGDLPFGAYALRRIPVPMPEDDHPDLPSAAALPGIGWEPATQGPIAWRRYCVTCRAHRLVRYAIQPSAINVTTFGDTQPRYITSVRTRQVCSSCSEPWPGPLLAAYVRPAAGDDPRGYGFDVGLVSRQTRAHGWIRGDMVAGFPEAVDAMWDAIERETLDRWIYRDPCGAEGCDERARFWYAQLRPIRLPFPLRDRAARHVAVCHEHEYQLRRDPTIGPHIMEDPTIS